MKHLLMALLSVLIFSGCATRAKYEAKLNSWMGMSESDLISAWGAPSNSHQMSNGDKIITYNWSYGASQTQYNAYTKTYYTTDSSSYCKTDFTISSSGIVKSWNYFGNFCKSK